MKRKSFEFAIGETKLLFFERNKEDSDYIAMSDRFRAHNFQFIQENTKAADDIGMLLMKEMDKDYTPEKISLFLYTNKAQIKRQLWDSFKLNPSQNGFTESKFFNLIQDQETVIFELLLKLEKKPLVKKKITRKK